MCCLFGLLDYSNRFTAKQRQLILHRMATECEERGTDATGISYLSGGRMRIYKRAVKGRYMWFRFPDDASFIMGHTRMTTQGQASRNYNNHPFLGRCGNTSFSLAHNGILWNDRQLRQERRLPKINIETDSYIAVQLLEQEQAINFASLKNMAEAVEGQFTFTVQDNKNNLYIVKGQNPMSLYHFSDGFYLYASTDAIMERILAQLPFTEKDYQKVPVTDGQILQIDRLGKQKVGQFTMNDHYSYGWGCYGNWRKPAQSHRTPIVELLAVANNLGYDSDDIVELLDSGFYEQDIEELLYEPEMMGLCLAELRHEQMLERAWG